MIRFLDCLGLVDDILCSLPKFEELQDEVKKNVCKNNCGLIKRNREYVLFVKDANTKVKVNDKERTLWVRCDSENDNEQYYQEKTITLPEDAILNTIKATKTENGEIRISIKRNPPKETFEGRTIEIK